MKHKVLPLFILICLIITACGTSSKNNVPVVGFVDFFEDATIAKARTGFVDALKKNGFSEDQKNVKIEFRNAQGSQPVLGQIVNYFIGQKVYLLATCTTLSTIAALQKTKTI